MVDLGQPTLAEVRQWRDSLVGNWGLGSDRGISGSVAGEEALYFQNYEIEVFKGQRAIKTGSAPSDAEGAMDALIPSNVQIRCRPARRTEKYRQIAEKRLRFAQGLVHGWRTPKDLLALVVADQVVRRVGVGRVLWDQRLWPEHPDDWRTMTAAERTSWDLRYRNRSPLTFEVRNPRYVGWEDLQDGTLIAVVEHYPVSAPEARVLFSRYPRAKQILAAYTTPDATVWVDDVWVGEYRCLMLQDEPLFTGGVFGASRGAHSGVVKSLYPEIPYVIFPFRELNFASPHDRYRGMLTNAGDLYRYESEMMGMVQQLMRWNSWRTWIGYFQGMEKEEGVEIHPGEMIQVRKHMNEYLEMLTGESFPPDILQGIQMYDAFITRNSVAGGAPMPGENRSAQQVWATQSLRQLKLERARTADQTGLAQALRLATVIGATFLGENEALTLPLPGRDDDGEALAEVTIRGADLRDYPDCYEVSFGVRIDPAIVELNKALAGFAQMNFIDQRRALEMGGMVESAQEVLDDLDIQATENLPFMKAMFALRRAKQWWGEDSDEYLMLKQVLGGELERMVQQSVGGAAPPAAPGAMPGAPPTGGAMPPNPVGMNVPGSLPQNGQQLQQNTQLGGRKRVAGRVASGRPPGMNAGGGMSGGGSP